MKIAYDYKTIPHQEKFHASQAPKAYLSTGYGGGKTYSLVMKMFQNMHINMGVPGGMLCPTLKMYKRDVLPTIREICQDNGIRYKYNKSESYFAFPATGSIVYIFHSEDDGQSIKGPTLGWMGINEIASISKMAFLTALSRIRHRKAKRLQVFMSGTPESFNWTYEYFIENPRKDTDLIIGDATANKFVHPTYFTQLTEDYDDLMQQMYIKGQWVNLAGNRALHQFDRMRHVKDDVNFIAGHPVWCALDFNVAPLAASLWQFIPTGYNNRSGRYEKRMMRCFDEVTLWDSNTWEFNTALGEKLLALGVNHRDVTIYPDPAGRGRSTQAIKPNYSDFDILAEGGFKNLKYKIKLSVRDCINAVNSLLKKDEILISSKCTNVIADSEQCVFKNNTFEIDKSNPKRTHWLDGFKNMIDYEFPLRRPTPMREGKR